jgi:hypothetical protein
MRLLEQWLVRRGVVLLTLREKENLVKEKCGR